MAAQINNIYEDIRKCYKHPNGGNPASNPITTGNAGDPVKDNDGVNYSGWDPIRSISTSTIQHKQIDSGRWTTGYCNCVI